jgi:hypothetical protein
MKKRKYGISVQPPKSDPKEIPNNKEIEPILIKAFEMFNSTGAKWSPVGGLEATVAYGDANRNHTDIDIELEQAQFHLFSEGMKEHGYKMCEKLFSLDIKISSYEKRIILYKNLNTKNIINKEIRLIYKQPDDVHPLLKVIDIKVCKKTPEGTIVYNKGKKITVNQPYEGKIVKFKGLPIQLRNPIFREYIKSIERKASKIQKRINLYDYFL